MKYNLPVPPITIRYGLPASTIFIPVEDKIVKWDQDSGEVKTIEISNKQKEIKK